MRIDNLAGRTITLITPSEAFEVSIIDPRDEDTDEQPTVWVRPGEIATRLNELFGDIRRADGLPTGFRIYEYDIFNPERAFEDSVPLSTHKLIVMSRSNRVNPAKCQSHTRNQNFRLRDGDYAAVVVNSEPGWFGVAYGPPHMFYGIDAELHLENGRGAVCISDPRHAEDVQRVLRIRMDRLRRFRGIAKASGVLSRRRLVSAARVYAPGGRGAQEAQRSFKRRAQEQAMEAFRPGGVGAERARRHFEEMALVQSRSPKRPRTV